MPLNASNNKMGTVGLKGINEKLDTYTSFDEFMSDINVVGQSYLAHFSSKCTFDDIWSKNFNKVLILTETFMFFNWN